MEDNLLLNRYCIPMDQYHRAVLSAEEKFFDECDTGKGEFVLPCCTSHSLLISVPVVVVFTKCDALLAGAFGKLKLDERKLPWEEQLVRIEEYAKEMLRESTAWERLKTRQYPPKDYVILESKCDLGSCNLVHSLLHRHAHI